MKRLLLILGMLLPPIFSMAQGNANNWVLGSNIQLDFSTTPPTLIKLSFNPGGTATINPGYNIESSTSVSDANGTLLFYSFGQFLYNGFDHTLVKSDLGTTLDACQGNMVIPKPGTNNQYLLFTVDAIPNSCGGDAQFGSNRGARYYTVTVNAATQSVTVDNGTAVPGAPNSVVEGQAACPTSNPNEYWYVIHDASGNPAANGNFKVYKVTSNGNVVFDHNETVGPSFGNCGAMNIKFNSCYTQMAVAAEGAVTLYSFDIATGTISNPSTASVPSAYGLEFSPNGQYLYVSTGVGNSGETPQLLRFANVNTGILGTPTVIAQMNASTMSGDAITKTGHLQLGPDGNIYSVNKKDYNYVGATTSQYVGVILNPNSATPTYNGEYIEIKDTNFGNQYLAVGMGLPTFLKSLVTSIAEVKIGSVSIDDESLCVGDNPLLSLNVVGGYTGTPSWKFTPPSGTPVQNFTGTNANPNFNEQGDWTLELSLQDNCGTPKTVTKILTVYPTITPTVTLPNTMCPNTNLTATASAAGITNFIWYDAATGGNVVGTGNSYIYNGTLPKSYWVEPAGNAYSAIGKSSGPAEWAPTDKYTYFTTTTSLFLRSASTFAFHNQAGTLNATIGYELRSGSPTGTLVKSGTFTVSPASSTASAFSFDINQQLPAGTYYLIYKSNSNAQVLITNGGATTTHPPLVDDGKTLATVFDDGAGRNGPFGRFVFSSILPCFVRAEVKFEDKNCCTPPTITTHPTNQTVCAGSNVTLSVNSSTASVNYQWQVDEGSGFTNLSTGTTLTLNNVTTAMSGNIYRAVITGTGICTTNSNTATLTVNPVPAAPTVSGNNSPYCHNSNISLTAASTGAPTGTVYTWTLSNSTTSTSNPFTANNATSTTAVPTSVNASYTNNGVTCTSTSTNVTVTVKTNPSVSLGSASQTICSGSQMTAVSVSVTNGTGFTWQGAGTNASGFTSTATDVASTTGNIQETLTATTAANGTVTYTVTPTNGTNGSGATCVGTAQTHTVTVTPSVTPSVSISASKTTICEGESVTFTASPTNGGASPGYQWKVNGNNAGTNSATFSSTTLSNNDVVTVEMTSDASCPDPATVTSNQITMTVEPVGTASVTISASETLICKGASITFTPTPVNGGTPTYQWLVNNSVVETNSSTFTSSTLNDGDEVKAIMTASGTCVTGSPAESNAITINVTEPLTPSVVIASNATNNEICSGQEVTFTATPTNGGTPTYQWKLNGSNVGTGATYTNNSLSQGDEIEVEMTTSETCVTSTTATSNTITMTVAGTVIPKVTITSNETTICEGEEVIFTATPENGGTSPSYQWMVNGVNAGTDSPTFSSSALTNGAQVTVVLTSSLGCASPNTATSSPVTITVNPNVTASVSITGNNSICEGTSVTFTATPTNEGSSPVYQWKVNGNNEGTNSNQFSSSTLQNGDVVTVEMTSNATCVTGSPATSNPITMSVAAKQAPSVSITATATTICSGQSVTFSATPINGGASPSYQWLVNGTPVTGSGITYTSTSLANEDEVWVEMTTSETCVTTSSPVSSNKIKINVTQTETPTVTIAEINNKTNICGGESLTFKATPNSSETNPVYQWQINGSPTGGNTDEFTSNSLQNGDVVTVILTSSLSCASSPTATSNPITLTVTNPVTATAQITGVNEFCKGEQITFTSNTTNEGSAPTYLWKVNNVVVGNGPTYTSNNLGNGDIIILELQSNATCVTNPTTSSNAITVTVKEPIVITDPLVSTSVCDGSTLNLTISATGSGPISYQWYFEGGIMAGETNSILSIPNVNSTHEGTYKVEISSSCGTKASQGFVAVNPSVDVTKQVEGSKICFNGDPTVVVRNSQHNVSYIAYNASNQALNNPVLGNGQDLTLNLNISGLSPGSNTITIKALAGGCGNANLTQKATVIILDEVSNEDLIGPLSICNDNLANIPFHISQVAGATSYIWYVGSAELAGQTQNAVNITFDKAQFTNVTVIPLLDGISCSSASIVVEQVPAYDGSAFLSVNEDTICEGNEITFKLENISPGTVVWSALPDFSHEITGNKISKTIRFDAAGTYIIRLAFEHPCNGTIPLEKEITVIATPVANAGSDIKLEDFATVVLDGSASTQGNLYTALWTSSDPSSEISRPFSLITAVVPKSVKTTYFLTITSTNEASCSAFDEVNVEIDLLVKVPNIFSPNGDGIHDYLMVNNIELFPNAVMYIYNQWGQEVYRSSPGYKDPWDGTKGGKPVPVSTYYYVLELNEEDFGPIKGSVTIVK